MAVTKRLQINSRVASPSRRAEPGRSDIAYAQRRSIKRRGGTRCRLYYYITIMYGRILICAVDY